MVKKIISHLPPRHLDDWLAICVLLLKYPKAQVEYIHPQQVPEKYLKDPEIILVDVGSVFEPRLRNYDHHQDLTLPCSLVLILCYELNFDIEKIGLPFLLAIDLIDRKGFKYASENLKIPPLKEIDEIRRLILISEPNELAGMFLLELIDKQEPLDFNEFIKALYTYLDKRGLLEEAKRKVKEEKKEFERKLKNITVLEFKTNLGNLKVGMSYKTLAPRHFEVFNTLDLDILIEKNSMNPQHTSVIKNTTKEISKKIDLFKLKEKFPVIFVHPAGFIAVIDKPIDEVDIKGVVACLT